MVVEDAAGVVVVAVEGVVVRKPEISTHETRYVPRSLLLQWHVTERCNLQCQHCYQDTVPGPELDFDLLMKILGQFKALLTGLRTHYSLPAHITLTGGEPFVRKDFPKLVEIIAGQPNLYSFAILTNGTFIDSDRASWLSKMKPAFVQVSLEGMQSTHDQIRGTGNFELTVKAIKNLTTKKIPTYISFTAQRRNYSEFIDIARLGRELNVQLVWSDRVIPAGRNHDELKSQALSTDEIREWLHVMAQARTEARRDKISNTEIKLNRALQFWVGNDQPYHCSAGGRLICLLSNGDLVPCRRMPIVVGNVFEQPLDELFHCKLFEELRNPKQVNSGCEKCLCNRLCGGGLRCLSYALTGSPFNADPGCWHVHADTEKTDLINFCS